MDSGVSQSNISTRKKLVFGLAPLMFLLLASEIVARVDRGTLLRLEKHRLLRLERVRRGYPSMHDPRLGYVPIPSYSSRDNLWQKQVSIDENGFRSNGSVNRPEGRPIVAVGDSFTFGDEVNDDETWPAWLEKTLERPVINGGVFGYSFGQSILRAEETSTNNRQTGWSLGSSRPTSHVASARSGTRGSPTSN